VLRLQVDDNPEPIKELRRLVEKSVDVLVARRRARLDARRERRPEVGRCRRSAMATRLSVSAIGYRVSGIGYGIRTSGPRTSESVFLPTSILGFRVRMRVHSRLGPRYTGSHPARLPFSTDRFQLFLPQRCPWQSSRSTAVEVCGGDGRARRSSASRHRTHPWAA
jgi:hypothetical protein